MLLNSIISTAMLCTLLSTACIHLFDQNVRSILLKLTVQGIAGHLARHLSMAELLNKMRDFFLALGVGSDLCRGFCENIGSHVLPAVDHATFHC